jgi:hypothetical protein
MRCTLNASSIDGQRRSGVLSTQAEGADFAVLAALSDEAGWTHGEPLLFLLALRPHISFTGPARRHFRGIGMRDTTVRQRRVSVSYASVVGLFRSLCVVLFVQYRCQCRAREGKEGFHHAEEDVSYCESWKHVFSATCS